eukprot:TRINITY_DN8103_c0_g2_i2.p1 TRINITY_DN8103_c0_g2~~TRINITY_DN8103_c0_g2_i2.p1  ORF type:complete len:306 (+),score=46.28 TRINITY_DN8103_c0_g2_i2:101-919(+)
MASLANNNEDNDHSVRKRAVNKQPSQPNGKHEHHHTNASNINDKETKPLPWYRPNLWWGAGYFMVIFYAYLVVVRYNLRGWYGAADVLWLCNLSVAVAAIGVFTRKNLLLSTALTASFIPHFLWYIDLLSYFITGSFPIGTAAYLVWPDISWAEVISSLHHAWFTPLCLLLLHRNGAYHKKAWITSILFVIPVVFVSSFIPEYALMEDGVSFYINVNMAHGWWKDMGGWPWNMIPAGSHPMYLVFLSCFVSVKFCVGYLLLRITSWAFLKAK